MKFRPVNLRVNYCKQPYAADASGTPRFSWGAEGSAGAMQSGYRITVRHRGETLWDSGLVKSDRQTAVYDGAPLPSGARVDWSVELVDDSGRASRSAASWFKTACYEKQLGGWIRSPLETAHEAQYFSKTFYLSALPERAVLYHCGIGLDKAYVNRAPLSEYRLTPAFTAYQKECRYVIDIAEPSLFRVGENRLDIIVCGGWRKNYGKYLDNLSEVRPIEFMGNMYLNAQLALYFSDGSEKIIATDDSWTASLGPITRAHLFDGETYDETAEARTARAEFADFAPERFTAETMEPVRVKRVIRPINSFRIGEKRIYDFGENLAGVVRLTADGTAGAGCRMILRHAELLDEKGGLFTAPLRGAKAADQYICRGGSCHIDYAPEFTYHGFRYAELTVDGEWEGDISVAALQFYTDLDTDAFFRCGSALANEIYRAAVRTERCNLHTIASDCPQRDERMGWMNDAVVRFMAMPYMFNIPKFFEKIAADIANEQDELGRITCTAPFIFGERPADPVCAAYFIAVEEHFRATGSADLIAAHYDRLARWSEYLKSREKDGIVSYSYYGDWAGPEDACSVVKTIGDGGTEVLEGYEPGAAHSRYLPGEMISTAVHYMQYRLLERFAERLRKTEDAARFGREAERVRAAFLKKWVSGGRVYQGAQGCQALALFLDILPERDRAEAAEILAGSVRRSGRLQTGNITTPMLFDVLIGYGYTDLAWELFTRREYPSLGYMIENGATTIWERYELKKDEGMNSHNHPMHGASAAFLCRSLAGFAIAEPAKKYGLRPKLPKELPYYEILFPLLCGGLYLKYERKFGNEYIMVNAPFGTEIELELDGAKYTLRAGLHRAKKESDNWIFI